jgi:hypothetical protein
LTHAELRAASFGVDSMGNTPFLDARNIVRTSRQRKHLVLAQPGVFVHLPRLRVPLLLGNWLVGEL